ncbi:signal peptide containing protein [Theileria equi strain WA]|uniref:Signal peptide containing protein n=1 Tax=Theileria equi strain WA TaxID=1537102 RepID=L1LE83_THEEQ|nr:signal peptide containing protein [Theileria equi strain WA]EKX73560.1 signal peptide containing protein [Theileria equi strain WA]|eukprot:XP_004833012.1 signal peptide containing protein [Theileria equi strain WA]
MRLIILVHILATIKLCSAGWPSCFGCRRGSEDEESYDLMRAHDFDDDNVTENDSDWQKTTTRMEEIPIALDISKNTSTIIRASGTLNSGVKYVDYFPRKSFFINLVSQDGVGIWTASGDERCVLSEVYERGECTILSLNITTANSYESKYFEKEAQGWKEIAFVDFFAKLEGMKCSS